MLFMHKEWSGGGYGVVTLGADPVVLVPASRELLLANFRRSPSLEPGIELPPTRRDVAKNHLNSSFIEH